MIKFNKKKCSIAINKLSGLPYHLICLFIAKGTFHLCTCFPVRIAFPVYFLTSGHEMLSDGDCLGLCFEYSGFSESPQLLGDIEWPFR